MAKQTFLIYYAALFVSIYLQYTKYHNVAPVIYAFSTYLCPNALLYLIIFYFEPKKHFATIFFISLISLIATSWYSFGNVFILMNIRITLIIAI
jgi:hypothetical protein